MAKIETDRMGDKKGPSLSGVFQIYTRNGVAVVAAWPRKRGKPKTQAHKDRVSFFKKANRLAKRSWDRYIWTVRLAVERTPFMPRDMFLALMAGRLFSVYYPDGRLYRSKRAMLQLSKVLDVITQVPGKMLIRGLTNWEAIDEPAGGGGGANWYTSKGDAWWLGTTASGNSAFMGEIITVYSPMTITRMMSRWQWTATGKYKFVVAALDAGNVITELFQSAEWSPTLNLTLEKSLAIAATLDVGTNYWVAIGRTDAGDAHALNIMRNSTNNWRFEGKRISGGRLAKAAPAIGHTISTTDTATPPLGLLASFDWLD